MEKDVDIMNVLEIKVWPYFGLFLLNYFLS